MKTAPFKPIQFAFILVLFSSLFSSCQKNLKDSPSEAAAASKSVSPKELKNFVQVNLVGNNDENKPMYIDPNLINAWGIVFPASGPALVSSEGRGMSAIYTLDGVEASPAVNIPGAGIATAGKPSGHVANFTSDFKLPNGNASQFIFATTDGTICGWNAGNNAVKKIDRSPAASYLGVTIALDGSNFFLYAANFAQNRIDVFDKNWNAVNRTFTDPDLPAGYSPFNIQTLSDGKIYVTYAKKDADGKRDIGPGNGYINVFSPNGTLLNRFASKGKLNAPWGIVKAPASFWGEGSQIDNIILVANYGDGRINAFDEDGNFIGPLHTNGKPVEIDGLWGITFPPINGLNRSYLYFASGPNNGQGGLVGYIKTLYLN